MKRLLLLLIVLIAAGYVSLSFFFSKKDQPPPAVPQKIIQQTAPEIKKPVAEKDLPIKLTIPAININADVEYVGVDDKGRMDVPKNVMNVAWYKLGFAPGEKGSAVIAAHFDDQTGAPAVFYDLGKLKPGDPINITLESGKKLTFTVEKSTSYPYDSFPLQEVFDTTDKPRLNLITCDGVWSHNQSTYLKRLVVYSVEK